MSDKLAEYYNRDFNSGESDSAPPPYSEQHIFIAEHTQQPYAHPSSSEEQGSRFLHTPSAVASGSRGLADSYYQNDHAHISPYTAQPAQYYPQQNSSSNATNTYQYPLPSAASSSQYSRAMTGPQGTLPGFTYNGKAPPKRDPFTPPPQSFTRAPNPDCPYPLLPSPIYIPSQTRTDISSGFAPIFPVPELLLAHDVLPEDFSRLLEDCHLMGQLVLGDKIKANVLPMVFGVGFLPGLFVTSGIENKMSKKKVDDVNGLVEVWDQAFFAPRRLRVWIEAGNQRDGKSRSRSSSSSSSSSGSSSDGGRIRRGLSDKGTRSDRKERRRQARRERRKEHRERKEARRERKHQRRESKRGRGSTSAVNQVYLVIGNRWMRGE